MNQKTSVKTRNSKNVPITVLLLIGCITIFFPLYMTIVIAFKKPAEMTNDIMGALKLPMQWSLSNFSEAMQVTDFWHSLLNSMVITLCTVALCVLIHPLAAYAIGRNMKRHKFYKFSYMYLVSGMFVPFAILMMPEAKLTAFFHLTNWAGVIILYVVFYLPMDLMLYTGYLKNVPLSLEEAAYVDGASVWTAYWHIIFPNMKPMHATVAVLAALGAWNDVMTPLILMGGSGSNTLPLAQLNFQSQFSTNYNLAFASYLLALVPILVFYLVCQKQIISGVINGAVK
ncbi:MAG: carbohydrate ABC transporter permease [Oscillospiraceae bacterium]|jgi:raffinose/stachyose/melibiose transport system permease protein|nr:carbohydrate ABC transporter permease [Oscillospiraceae bacterium]